jgi:peptide-methionine (R)-S-oxide reductase
MEKINKTDGEWQAQLTGEQFDVCRRKGTERAFTGEYDKCYDNGTYQCICCGASLFSSQTKFSSGTGWPSFYAPLNDAAVGESEDGSFWMRRTEVHCARCDSHLGHVFPDGPEPTGLRYCLNSASLKLASD